MECLRLTPHWVGQVPWTCRTGEVAVQNSLLPGIASRLGGGIGLSLVTVFVTRASLILASLLLRIGMMTEFFPKSWTSTLTTQRLKSSITKDKPCGPKWWSWSTVSPLGTMVVEKPAFLISDATPL